MTGEEEEGRGFKVQDRRRFSETGEARADADAGQDPPAVATATSPPPPHNQPDVLDVAEGDHAHQASELNFAAFVISLSTQALAHLGEIPDPVQGTVRVELNAARQMIDILVILRDKTKGNLDSAEKALLDSALYDLRMKYVEKARR
jgi:hypothetical protein